MVCCCKTEIVLGDCSFNSNYESSIIFPTISKSYDSENLVYSFSSAVSTVYDMVFYVQVTAFDVDDNEIIKEYYYPYNGSISLSMYSYSIAGGLVYDFFYAVYFVNENLCKSPLESDYVYFDFNK